jgi:hypothetical protein
MIGEAPRAGPDQYRAVAGEAHDAVDARGLDGFSAAHRGKDGGSRPANIDLPVPGGLRRSTLWSERLQGFPLDTMGDSIAMTIALRWEFSRDVEVYPSRSAFGSTSFFYTTQ